MYKTGQTRTDFIKSNLGTLKVLLKQLMTSLDTKLILNISKYRPGQTRTIHTGLLNPWGPNKVLSGYKLFLNIQKIMTLTDQNKPGQTRTYPW